jgi:hypothetical protein
MSVALLCSHLEPGHRFVVPAKLIEREPEVALRHRVASFGSHPIELHRLLLVLVDALPAVIHIRKIVECVDVPELHGAPVNLRRFLQILGNAWGPLEVLQSQKRNRFRHLVLHVATQSRKVLRCRCRTRRPTERARLDRNLVMARSADHAAAADAQRRHLIHVPVLKADRAPRPISRIHRLRLRVRLAPRASGLVFRGDARADLVGVRPRRGAVDRERRRGRRRLGPRRLRRALVPDLLARLPVASVAPIDALTVRRTVPAGPRRGAIARRPRPFASVATAPARTVSSRTGNSVRSSVSPRRWYM